MAGDDDDLEIVTGTESEGAGGQDADTEGTGAEVPAEQSDQQENDGEQEVAAQPEKGATRGENRIQRLANERAAEKARADRLEQELNETRRQTWQAQQTRTREEHEARRALMTPEERMQDDMAAMRRQFDAERQQDRINTASLMDKTAYDAKATINPVYAKYQDEVETRFQELAKRGQPVEREILLKVLLGERALAGAANPKPRKAAESRVASQRVSAGSGKGDTPTARAKAGDTAESRLKDVFI